MKVIHINIDQDRFEEKHTFRITPELIEISIKSAQGWKLPENNPSEYTCANNWQTATGFL